ncbi:MAG: hypothetical protein KDK91_25405 [Gammaproteobacteria bacterium]|nr:hypothetical protein [Gammaproteobacteria bacterium]
MNRVVRVAGMVGLAAATLGSLPATVAAQGLVDSYAVKVVCRERSDDTVQVVSGRYMTSVNIYNPHDFDIKYEHKASRARLMRATPNPAIDITATFGSSLVPMQAESIDCNDIRRMYLASGVGFPAFYEGFVNIRVPTQGPANMPPPVDVQVVYTAEKRIEKDGLETDIETIDVETVEPKRVRDAAAELPDLVPMPDQNGFFCRLVAGGLLVETANQDSGAAGPSKVTVDFPGFGSQTQNVPGLAAGTSSNNVFPIPPSCFNPDCDFRIIVDDGDNVIESDESNNTASGFCLG